MTDPGTTTPTGRPRRGRPPTSPLTPALILESARALVEREGPDALTLRRLGTELGSNHTAVLRHFAGKDEIVLGLAEQLIEEALAGFVPQEGWRDTLTALARRVRTACLAHPAVAVLVATRVSRRAAEFRGADTVIGALRQAGFGELDAARYYRVLADTVLAVSSYEASVSFLDDEARRGDRMAWQREYLAVSPVRYPHLAAVAGHLAAIDAEDQFETVLELLLDAVELRALRAARER
ncbi:TetR/AcrR family transcriptional regulator [Kitasatospora sp. NPDC004289]